MSTSSHRRPNSLIMRRTQAAVFIAVLMVACSLHALDPVQPIWPDLAPASTVSGDASDYTIQNTVNTFDMENTIKTKVGYQYWFADKKLADGKTLKLSVVEPGKATHAPHQHTEDEFFFVLEGTAEFHLDGETAVGGPMTSFYCPTGSKHGIRNIGDTELKYLVIKQYILD